MALSFGKVGTLNVRQATAVAGTPFYQIVEPYPGPISSSTTTWPILQTATLNSDIADVITHLDMIAYRSGGTSHTVIVNRPLNYTTLNGAVAANSTSVIITADPGVYSTNYLYPKIQKTAAIADNAIAANDYVAFQLADGTWWWDKVASVASLTLTMTTALPNISGGGATSGARLYFFGLTTDKDPATGYVQPQFTHTAAAALYKEWSALAGDSGIVAAMHPGDPLLIYSANATNAGTLEFASGFYLKR